MRVLYSWLKEFVDIPWEPGVLAERLTMAGLEVEEVAAWPPVDERIVIGRILSAVPHPNAGYLFICRTDVGEREISIVCGASNARPGVYAPVALPGALLPYGGGVVETASIRGIASEGVICSEKELGISGDHSGIMVLSSSSKPGSVFREYGAEPDAVLDIFITPNRGDCLSIAGIAREIAALSGNKIRMPEVNLSENGEGTARLVSVELIDVEGCPRYTARIIKDLKIGESPFWMKNRLEACGQRSINNIVDVTNYVLIEIGQPLHAFDLKLLRNGKITVRAARQGEPFTTLDGVQRMLGEKNLLICDGDHPVALAGVMGGANSEVGHDTTDVLLESAFFNQKRIRQSSGLVGLSSEASRRFEKGIDPETVVWASDRASALLALLAGGRVLRGIVDENRMPGGRRSVSFRPDRCKMLLGADINAEEMKSVFTGLGCSIRNGENGGSLNITIPGFRWDLTREVDLIEEISRILGFERIEAKFDSSIRMNSAFGVKKDSALDFVKETMTGIGFYEVVNNIMGDRFFSHFLAESESLVALANPLNDEMRYLRPSLIPSLIEVFEWNKNRDVENVRIFEAGKVFAKNAAGYVERFKLAGLLSGESQPRHWSQSRVLVEYYDVKGIIETILRKIYLDSYKFIRYDKVKLNNAFSIACGSVALGYFGELPADFQEITGGLQTFVFEIDLDPVLNVIMERVPKFRPVSRFPGIKRDIVFLVDNAVPGGEMVAEIERCAGDLLKNVAIFDLYEGKQIPGGKKSIGFSLLFGSEERTLPESLVNEIIGRIFEDIKRKFGADLRPLK